MKALQQNTHEIFSANSPSNSHLTKTWTDGKGLKVNHTSNPFKPVYANNLLDELITALEDRSIFYKATDWKIRSKALKEMGMVVQKMTEFKMLENFNILKLATPLITQLLDLRSSIVKDTCELIMKLAMILKSKFEILAERLISTNCLLKCACASNKVISESAHQSILTIFSHVVVPKIIHVLADEYKSKNQILRNKITEYFFIILQKYPLDIIEKNQEDIEKYLKAALTDALQETREMAKLCIRKYQEIFPDKSNRLLLTLDSTILKALKYEKISQFENLNPSLNNSNMNKIELKTESVEEEPEFTQENEQIEVKELQTNTDKINLIPSMRDNNHNPKYKSPKSENMKPYKNLKCSSPRDKQG